MKFLCLGTNGFHPSEDAHTSCYMIPELGVVFDAGTGFFRVPKKLMTNELDIFLSHGHMDHTAGLQSVLEILELTKCKVVRIHGEKHVLESVSKFFEKPLFPVKVNCMFIPLGNDPIKLPSGAIISFFHLDHTESCVGYRLDYEGHSMAYVTDTHTHKKSSYIRNLHNIDFIAHEMNYGPSGESICQKFGHSSTIGIYELCKIINPKTVVAIHRNPNEDKEKVNQKALQLMPNLLIARDHSEFSMW